MGSVVTMSQTVGDLTSGQIYFVRSREAELMKAQSKCTIGAVRGTNMAVLPAKTGKRGQ